MRTLLFSLLILLSSQSMFAQNFNVDELIKMRDLNKSELQNYLTNQNLNWEYQGFSNNVFYWNLKKSSTNTLILSLYISMQDNRKNYIQLITGDLQINENILKQISEYKMKKTSSNVENTIDGEILTELFQGANYKIQIIKARNEDGNLIIASTLAKI